MRGKGDRIGIADDSNAVEVSPKELRSAMFATGSEDGVPCA